MAQHIINPTLVSDSYIDKNNPSTNFSSATELKLQDGGSSGSVFYPFLNFNLSIIPARKRVTAASLTLNQSGVSDFTYGVCAVSDDPATVTYNNMSGGKWYNDPAIVANVSGLRTLQCTNVITYIINGGAYHFLSLFVGGYGWPNFISFNSKESGSSIPSLSITYEDVPPSKPTLNEPIGSFEINTEVIRLSWNYISSVGGTQKGFNLQHSTDQSTWTTVSQTTANNYYDAPAGTFTAGNVYWRVQTINEYDETSDYSNIVAFYAIGAPETPVIQSVTNSAKPTITWASSGQQVYQVQALQDETLLHDSGILPGMETRSYKLPIYLANGDYTAKVRIKNEYDMFSEWGIADFTLSVVPPDKPTLSAQKTILGIELHIINNSDKALIYRDNVCIASITGDAFTDYSAAHGVEYEYFVRAVNSSEAFNDSDPVFIRPELKNNLFAPVSDLGDIIRLRYNKNTIPSKTINLNPISTATYYSGRNHAVTEFSEHEESATVFSFFIQDIATIKKFKNLIKSKETVLFRDARGRKIYGILSGWNETDDRSGHQIGFTLTEADYNEEVIE